MKKNSGLGVFFKTKREKDKNSEHQNEKENKVAS